MGRAPCCDKANVKRGPWSPEEDLKLKDYLDKHGNGGNWIALPQKAGLKRCGKSCRLRWLNYLRPNIKHGEFSEAEDRLICGMFAKIGSRWSIIAAQLPGRTDNDIKNYWNTKLRKKIMGSSSSSSPFLVPSNYYPHHPTGSLKLSPNPCYPFSSLPNMNHQQLLIPSFTTSSTITDERISNNLLLNSNVDYNYSPSGLGPNNNSQPHEVFVSPPPIQYLMFGGVNHHDQASSSSEGSCSQISHGNYNIFCDGGGLQMKQEESNKIGLITNEYGNRSEISHHSSNKFMLDFGSSKAINGDDHNYLMDATTTWNNDHIDHQKTNGYFGHSNNLIATTTTSSNTPLEYDSLEEVKQLIRVNNNSFLSLNDENKTKEGKEEEEEERMRNHMYFY